MDTKIELEIYLTEMDRMVASLRQMLEGGCTKPEFIGVVTQIENHCAQVRATVIRHSRGRGRGVRADGQPDRRFRSNRGRAGTAAAPPRPDLRLSKG